MQYLFCLTFQLFVFCLCLNITTRLRIIVFYLNLGAYVHVLFLRLLIEKSWFTVFVLPVHKILFAQLKIKWAKLLGQKRLILSPSIRIVLVLFFRTLNFVDFDFGLILRDIDLFQDRIGCWMVEFNFFAFSFLHLFKVSLRDLVFVLIRWRIDSWGV